VPLALRFRTGLVLDRAKAGLFGVPLDCRRGQGSLKRVSRDAALEFEVGGRSALVCYGRPLARGRRIFGGLVPYGELWRTGANEPTILTLPFGATVAGLEVPRGRYSVYTVPHQGHWTLVLNRSTRQWGLTRPEVGARGRRFPSAYTPWVRSAEVGRAEIRASPVSHVEELTIRAQVISPTTTTLRIAWETTEIEIPVSLRSRRGSPRA